MFKHFFIAFFLLGILVFAGCGNSRANTGEPAIQKKVQEYFPDSVVKTVWEYPADDSSIISVTHYYHNQHVQMKGKLKNGVREGKWVAWDEDGKIQAVGFYIDGFEHGLYTVYYPGGKKFYEGKFDMGRRVGVWKFWGEDGKLLKEIDYGMAPPPEETPDSLPDANNTH